MKGDLTYVSIRDGALSMEMDGLLVTLKLPVDNWDLNIMVSYVVMFHIDISY